MSEYDEYDDFDEFYAEDWDDDDGLTDAEADDPTLWYERRYGDD